MSLKPKFKQVWNDKTIQTVVYVLVWIIVFGYSTTVLIEWYISPVLDGMNMVNDYFDWDYLSIIEFDEKLDVMKEDFKQDFIDVTNDESKTVDESIIILQGKLEGYEDEMFGDFYSVIIYQFTPLVTLPAVFYLHIKFWSWVSRKICKTFKVELPKKELKI